MNNPKHLIKNDKKILPEVKDFSSQSFSSDTLQGKSSERSRIETELNIKGKAKFSSAERS